MENFNCNKRKRLYKKRVQLLQDWFETPTWPPFYLGHQYGGRDVIRKRSIVTPSNTKGTSNLVSPASALQRSLYYGTKDCLEFGIRPQEREK